MSDLNMSEEPLKVFETISGWIEYSRFETQHQGYITQERMGDWLRYFFWGVDKEPALLDHTFIGGHTFVRYSDNTQTH